MRYKEIGDVIPSSTVTGVGVVVVVAVEESSIFIFFDVNSLSA